MKIILIIGCVVLLTLLCWGIVAGADDGHD